MCVGSWQLAQQTPRHPLLSEGRRCHRHSVLLLSFLLPVQQEASSLKSPWEQHVTAPDAAAMLEIDQEVDLLCTSPDKKPTHDKIEKLLEMRSSLSQHAHVKCSPEDAMWRDEVRRQSVFSGSCAASHITGVSARSSAKHGQRLHVVCHSCSTH